METKANIPFDQQLRIFLYLVTPNETSFQSLEDVPNYVDGAIPYFGLFIVLECLVLKLQGKRLPRINDGINSMSHGLLSVLQELIFRPCELLIYVWIYNNFRMVDLPWNKSITWILGLLFVDFSYYWFHRLSHEINLIWASHQVHHSSEEYNFTTAIRQSMMQKYFSMLFHFPMAVFLPPSAFYVHRQFNLLYQFWIHTELVTTIGPLEYIMNTPSHHRVHHGRNPYCIDKNYAGTFIIWDRIFNTFQAEEEKVIYGLVHPLSFWTPVYGQFYHFLYIFGLVGQHKGLGNKLSAVMKGPGWGPGKPWLGLKEELPEVEQPVRQYDSSLPFWASWYVAVHFALIIAMYSSVVPYKEEWRAVTGLACILFFVYSITTFGALFDHWRFSSMMEFVRCAVVLGTVPYLSGLAVMDSTLLTFMNCVFIPSAMLWLFLTLMQYQFQVVSEEKKLK